MRPVVEDVDGEVVPRLLEHRSGTLCGDESEDPHGHLATEFFEDVGGVGRLGVHEREPLLEVPLEVGGDRSGIGRGAGPEMRGGLPGATQPEPDHDRTPSCQPSYGRTDAIVTSKVPPGAS